MFYGAVVWDPVMIIAQIVTLQCLFYMTLGLWQAILVGPLVRHLTIGFMLDWRTLNIDSRLGWMTLLSHLLNAPIAAVMIMWIVERAKKCLDFASTVYILHLAACWSFSGFPSSMSWWSTNALALLILAIFGEWLCVRREMQEIPLNQLRNRQAAARQTAGVQMAVGPLMTTQRSKRDLQDPQEGSSLLRGDSHV